MRKRKIYFCLFGLLVLISYGAGRLYFYLTDGFNLTNIQSDLGFHPEWEVRPLNGEEKREFEKAIDQPYHYLGKGCQSYVFASADGQYVAKFFKYQRCRLALWFVHFPPLPAIVKYRQEKEERKWNKLNGVIQSWKTAFEHLKEETGLIFVHLNKTTTLGRELTVYDKTGTMHRIALDEMEFCIQKRAKMLCHVLLDYKQGNQLLQAEQLIDQLLSLIVSEYRRGLADNDHALMQNTGVAQGKPVHIDVGQFVCDATVKQSEISHQEIVTKTYKFKLWLDENYPELGAYLEKKLGQIVGSSYATMEPQFRKK